MPESVCNDTLSRHGTNTVTIAINKTPNYGTRRDIVDQLLDYTRHVRCWVCWCYRYTATDARNGVFANVFDDSGFDLYVYDFRVIENII